MDGLRLEHAHARLAREPRHTVDLHGARPAHADAARKAIRQSRIEPALYVSDDIEHRLARLARQNLKRTGWDQNVAVVAGDGSVGYREGAPYDAIAVAAAAPDVPEALVKQLRDPGRLVIPVGTRNEQSLTIVTKRKGVIKSRVETHCRFVPLLGDKGWR